jgi:hypothetical protein
MKKGEAAKYLKTCVVEYLGGCEAVGRLCGKSGKAVQKWVKAGRLPRTEATGETNYAETLSNADPRIEKEKLLAGVYKNGSAPRGKFQEARA